MGRLFLIKLDGTIYSCRICQSHLAASEEIISRNFHSRQGKAYLFNNVVNVTEGPIEERMMRTGMHAVCDIHCNGCHRIVGWKYEKAYAKEEQYKEGKFILELAKTKIGSECGDLYSGPHPPSVNVAGEITIPA